VPLESTPTCADHVSNAFNTCTWHPVQGSVRHPDSVLRCPIMLVASADLALCFDWWRGGEEGSLMPQARGWLREFARLAQGCQVLSSSMPSDTVSE